MGFLHGQNQEALIVELICSNGGNFKKTNLYEICKSHRDSTSANWK